MWADPWDRDAHCWGRRGVSPVGYRLPLRALSGCRGGDYRFHSAPLPPAAALWSCRIRDTAEGRIKHTLFMGLACIPQPAPAFDSSKKWPGFALGMWKQI